MQERVEAALRQLSAHDRAILTLHYQEERSYEEIAAILDRPMGTVKTHLYRARERLKVIMKERTNERRNPSRIGVGFGPEEGA